MRIVPNAKQELTERLKTAVEYLSHQAHAAWLDEWDRLEFTIPQAKTLALLERAGPLRMGNIADSLGRALSATTTVIDRLVDREFVARGSDPNDRRVVICELTAAGREALDGYWGVGRNKTQSIADNLTEAQLESLLDATEGLLRIVQELPGFAGPRHLAATEQQR